MRKQQGNWIKPEKVKRLNRSADNINPWKVCDSSEDNNGTKDGFFLFFFFPPDLIGESSLWSILLTPQMVLLIEVFIAIKDQQDRVIFKLKN